MAISIDECKKLLQYRATKSGYNGNLSPNDFNTIFASAERRHFNNEYKRFGVNQENVDSLNKFKTDPIPITIDSAGKYTKTSDLLHIDSIRHSIGGKQVEITKVNDDRLASYLDSEYEAPTSQYPIYVEYKAYIQFYPITLGTANLVYLKDLVPAVWGYTLVSGRPVYNVGTSVQPLWSQADIDEIIYLAGLDLGVNVRDNTLIQINDKLAKENV